MSPLRPYSKSRLARLSKEGRGLNGTFAAKTMPEIISAKQAQHEATRAAIRDLQKAAKSLDKPTVTPEEARALVKPRPKKKEEITRAQAEKLADAAYSQFRRLEASDDNGILRCFICRRPVKWNRAHLMHFHTRAGRTLRFHDQGTQPGCRECNGKPNGDRDNYALRLDAEYGAGTAERLTIESKTMTKRTTIELLEMARDYRLRVERIKEESPNKFSK